MTIAPMPSFPARHWKERIDCACGCGRKIKTGIVAANDHSTPPAAALSPACYAALMADPHAFVATRA